MKSIVEYSENQLADYRSNDYTVTNSLILEPLQLLQGIESAIFSASGKMLSDTLQNFTLEELGVKSTGKFTLGIAIDNLAMQMGYDLSTLESRRHAYRTIRDKCKSLKEKTVIITSEKINSEKEEYKSTNWNISDYYHTIEYDAKSQTVYFTYSDWFIEKMMINHIGGNYTHLNQLTNRRINKSGNDYAVILYQLLKVKLGATKKEAATFTYDITTIKIKLGMINAKEDAVIRVLKEYPDLKEKNIEEDQFSKIAAIEDLDSLNEKAIKDYESTPEYKNRKSLSKEERQTIDSKMKLLKNNKIIKVKSDKVFEYQILKGIKETFLKMYTEFGDEAEIIFNYSVQKYKSRIINVIFDVYTIKEYKKRFGLKIDRTEEKDSEDNEEVVKEKKTKSSKKTKEINQSDFEETVIEFEKVIKEQEKKKGFKEECRLSVLDIIEFAKSTEIEVLRDAYLAVIQYSETNDIDSMKRIMKTAIKKQWKPNEDKPKKKKQKNPFNVMLERDYDYEELEKQILEED